ncbi:MAG TPA: DNA-binding transcriptional regulator [Steroidobacteraceae bacterium]|jgi:putative transcriptional regulator
MKKPNRLLREIRESVVGLHRAGLVDKQTMREFDILTLPQVRNLTPKQIRILRSRSKMSQAVFAAFLNTSVSTVQKWEIGEKKPSGPSLKLLNVIDQKGVDALI